jgi:hypothetical protein
MVATTSMMRRLWAAATRAADRHRKERGGAVGAGHLVQQPAAGRAQRQRKGRRQRDPAGVARQHHQHRRAEVQAERAANRPLPRLARRHRRAQGRAQHACGRSREQRAEHPWQRRVEPDARERAEHGQQQCGNKGAQHRLPWHRRAAQKTQSFSAGICSQ